MSWGNFCFIPGPKKWDEEARPYMLGWLPTVGAIMGLIWAMCFYILFRVSLPVMAAAAILTWVPFVLSGFIHVDGYMDVNDAVMSRGTLEKKRAILKDSRCGTFAIVSLIFLVLVEFGFMASACEAGAVAYARLVMIMTVPRAFSGLMMMTLKPMNTSQYIEMKRDHGAEVFLLVQTVLWIVIAALVSGGEPVKVLLTAGLCLLGTLVSIFMARHELQGMNGDIAGYGILWGELLGIVSLVL